MAGLAARVLLALTVFIASGEVLARALHVVDRLNGYSRALYARGPSDDLPYVLRPGVQTMVMDVPVRVNRHGMRGAEIAEAPPADVRRVLLLGDSVVFGRGVTEEQAPSAELARRLNAAGRGRWEVLNAGVQGYDTVAEARFLEVRGLALHPAVVVVGTSLNDYDPPPALSAIGVLTRDREASRDRLLDRSEFLLLLRWLWAWGRGELWHQQVARLEGGDVRLQVGRTALDRLVRAEHLRFYRDPPPAQWSRLRTALADLGRIAGAHGVRLLVAIFPESYQVGAVEPDLTPQRRLLDACREAGVPCLDLQPAFARAGGELFLDAQHPNARGHAVAADAIADALLAP